MINAAELALIIISQDQREILKGPQEMQFTYMNGGFEEMLGFIPMFLNENDPRSAREQLDANYQHGGGWYPMPKWKMDGDTIQYPGDKPLKPVAMAHLRDEIIYVYPYSWVCVVQKDGSFEVSRMD